MLTDQERRNLLKFSRQILEDVFKNPKLRNQLEWVRGLIPEFAAGPGDPRALFVTLHKGNDLRGCVGTIAPELPLWECLAQITLQSAFSDPRFPPLGRAELNEVQIEISVLSPLVKINHPDQIIPSQHGVYIRKGWNAGLFLPQVWNELPRKEDFLSALCQSKAGLSPDDLSDPQTEIYVFTVEIIREGQAT